MNFQGYNASSTIAKPYLDSSELQKLRTLLNKNLNQQRQTCFKKRKLFRCRRGDIAAQRMVELGVTNTTDINFQTCVQNNQLLGDNFDLLVFQFTHQQFLQMPTEQEAKEGFVKAFDEMFNVQFKSKLLRMSIFTHISLGLQQVGNCGEVFKILCLLQKKPISLNVIGECNSQIEGLGRVFVGQVLDAELCPVMIILNHGQLSEVKLSTKNILYDKSGASDEFKFWLTDFDIKGVDPFKDHSVPVQQMSADIFMQQVNYASNIVYGQGPDGHLMNPDPGWQHAYSDRIPATIKQISISLTQALQEVNLQAVILKQPSAPVAQAGSRQQLIDRLQNGGSRAATVASQATRSVTQTVSQLPRKTKAQLLMEKKSEEMKQRQNQNQLTQPIPMGSGMNTPHSYLGGQPQTGFQPTASPQIQGQTKLTFQPLQPGLSGSLPNRSPQLTQARNTVSFGLPQPSFATGTNFQGFRPNNSTSTPLQFNTSSFNRSQTSNLQPSQANNLSFQPFQPPPQPQMEAPKLAFAFKQPPMTTPMPASTSMQLSQPPACSTQQSSAFQPCKPQWPVASFQAPQFKPLTTPTMQQQTKVEPSPAPMIQQPMNLPAFQPPVQPSPLACSQFVKPNMSFQTQPPFSGATLPHLPPDLVSLYTPELISQLSQSELSYLNSVYHSDPAQFAVLLQVAHAQFQRLQNEQNGAQQVPVNWENKFMKEVLFSCEIGVFVTQLQNSDLKVDKSTFQRIVQEEVKQYRSDAETGIKVNHEAIALRILKKVYDVKEAKQVKTSEGYERMYEEHKVAMADKNSREAKRCDLVLLLRGQKFRCHQFVFKIASRFFEKIIQKNEIEFERKDCGYAQADALPKQKLQLPDWLSPPAFSLFIKFLYLGHMTPSSPSAQLPQFGTLFDLLMLSHFFHHKSLPLQLVLEALLPQMSLKHSLYVLKEIPRILKKHLPHITLQDCPALLLLQDYSLLYLSYNLPAQLRLSRSSILNSLSNKSISECLQMSLQFIRGSAMDNRDLGLIVDFAGEVFGDGSIYKLLNKISMKFKLCQAFDSQKIPKMREFLLQTDHRQMYYVNLIKSLEEKKRKTASGDSTIPGESHGGSQRTDKVVSSEKTEAKMENEKTFVQSEMSVVVLKQQLGSLYEEVNLDKFKPKYNQKLDKYGKPVSSEAPNASNLSLQISLSMAKLRREAKERELEEGVSIITEAFDGARRSWHLKLDFDRAENLSIYLAERGMPTSEEVLIQNPLTPSFSSVILDIQVTHKLLGDRQSSIFYSFAHNTQQVIGHKKFLNLSQLQNSDEFTVKVYLSEFLLHSAVMHQIADNFPRLFKQDYNTLFYENIRNRCSIFNMSFCTLYHLLMSNSLRVEDENTVLGYLFHYLENFGGVYPEKTTRHVANLLVQALRYNFLCLRKIMSALRRNEWLRGSKIFMDLSRSEMSWRVNHSKLNQGQTGGLLLSSLDQTLANHTYLNEEDVPVDAVRDYYDMVKIKNQGRNKQEAGDVHGALGMIEEIFTWAVTATVSNDKVSSERSKKRQISLERNRLADDLWSYQHDRGYKDDGGLLKWKKERELEREVQERRRQQDQLELNRLRRQLEELKSQSSKPAQSAALNAGSTRQLPRFLQNKENIEPRKNDSLANFASPPKPNGYDTQQAIKKIQGEKGEADFDALLNQLNLSPVAPQKGDNSLFLAPQPVACKPRNPLLQQTNGYQLRTRLPIAGNQPENSHCDIF